MAGEVSPGLGKLSGGDYEGLELVRARVEFASGVRWFHPGELDRVHPHVEAALVRHAITRDLIAAGNATRLEQSLEAFWEGRQEFYRTPGLLDELWLLHRGPAPTELGELFDAPRAELLAIVPQLAPPLPQLPRETRLLEAEELHAEAWKQVTPIGELEEDEDWSSEWERAAPLGALVPPRTRADYLADDQDDDDPDDDEEWELRRRRKQLAEAASALCQAFLSAEWSADDLLDRGQRTLGTSEPWLEELVDRVLAAFPARPHPEDEDLVLFLAEDEALHEQLLEGSLVVWTRFFVPPQMRADRRFPVMPLEGAPDVERWLRIGTGDLQWLADQERWLYRHPSGPLQHYHYHWLPKRSGGRRLVEAPKELLKSVQRQILRDVLGPVPPHEAAHGFCRGRSVRSYAEPHAGQELVLGFDLREFFPTIRAPRVSALFRALGYPSGVAQLLSDLRTTVTPSDVLEEGPLSGGARGRLEQRHLPQGSPTSPALANLCAYGLPVRLSAAAAAVSARYTRYADDLAFSGGADFLRQASRFRYLVMRIAAEEGFEINPTKNRWMRPQRQQRLTGLVVNVRPRPSRAEFDRLKATLHNCGRHGPASQNRAGLPDFRAHLAGRVSWFEQTDPVRGERLRELFHQITWET
ncbi:MAG TPA: hypothetical protein DEA08_23515 [Planctomycetes bacterium]|nr:hypothetical protein [Planctomycetota bacterium]